MTPYEAHKYVNMRLEESGLSKRIPPQMMYNYTSQRLNANKKPLIAFDFENGVDVEDLKRWTDAYITKQGAVVAKQELLATATFAEVY